MKVIAAFDSFKGCLSASDACRAAAEGLLSAGAEVVCLPLSDGGEGMVECLCDALNLKRIEVEVHGPLMEPVRACYGISADGTTAYMEMASASGLTLVPKEKRNPMLTTTYGVGEMVWDAVCRGCQTVVMGIGGSATCDGGSGMVEALRRYAGKDLDAVKGIRVVVASDVANPLYGADGAACIFAPQKGATAKQVEELDLRLRNFARETEEAGFAVPSLAECPGAGAAGGLGYALMAYLKAEMRSGIGLVLDLIGFDAHLGHADLVITGEGHSDAQTLMGKVPMGVLQRAQAKGVPVWLLSGGIDDREALLNAGFQRVASVNEGDERPLEVLMQREVAMQNIRNALLFH